MSPLRVFVSYCHQDELYLGELEKHLTTLKRENLISTWHDRKIENSSRAGMGEGNRWGASRF